jgi:glutathione peroxidase
MQQLYLKHSSAGFTVLAFPCNQFGAQESGTNEDIKAFAAGKGATFPLFSKIDVNGPTAHPLYQFMQVMGRRSEGSRAALRGSASV